MAQRRAAKCTAKEPCHYLGLTLVMKTWIICESEIPPKEVVLDENGFDRCPDFLGVKTAGCLGSA